MLHGVRLLVTCLHYQSTSICLVCISRVQAHVLITKLQGRVSSAKLEYKHMAGLHDQSTSTCLVCITRV